MTTLQNANGEAIPARPELTDEIIKKGIQQALSDGGLSCFELSSLPNRTRFTDDVLSSFDEGEGDAYQLAKTMDNTGNWHVDATFVHDMNTVIDFVEGALAHAERVWSEEHQPFSVFDEGAKLIQGIVLGVDASRVATYRVKAYGCDNNNRWLIVKFENAQLAA
jgi:hypothetical protein